MNNTNTLVSSDNVGLASVLFEQRMNKQSTKIIGKGPFVAGFASTNLGDVSPNIKGPKCQMSGLPCDPYTSTCKDKKEKCVASGPGKDMFESTAIIATRIFERAWVRSFFIQFNSIGLFRKYLLILMQIYTFSTSLYYSIVLFFKSL
ncbi:hypothetical protein O3M35_009317 [Rhynocoris fuscipes]|uniref:Neutral ceramidase n=1 Tax=Rhynocoris fuscipes TaxID=488301 RepID=A0AAW1D4S6_9HEMI